VLAAGIAVPLPSPLTNYKARATHEGGALLCTVLAVDETPLSIFGVVLHAGTAINVRPILVAQFGAADGLNARHRYGVRSTFFLGSFATRICWSGLRIFEQCVAWAGAER